MGRIKKYLIPGILICSLLWPILKVHGQDNYIDYHHGIIKCEQLIADNSFKNAIANFDSLFSQYDDIFLRDCKVAIELAVFENDIISGSKFLRLGILNGWTLKSIKKSDIPIHFQEDPQWQSILSEYDSLHNQYLKSLNISLKNQVHEMFKKDQKKAILALFRIGQKSKDKYAEKKFAPHSEKQLSELSDIFKNYAYPGENLIGNDFWVSTILSHHNSISENYNSKDTLYLHLKPKLLGELNNGQVSPYELAVIEDWRTAVLSRHQLSSYGFLGAIPNDSAGDIVDQNRARIGLRSIQLRNDLIDIEKETGINLYLPKGWQKGKITVSVNH